MMREADKLFRKFLASDLAADHVPILVLMKRYCKMGEFNKVFELCQKWLVTLRRSRMLLKNYCEVKGTPNVLILEDKATKDFAPGWLTNFRSRKELYDDSPDDFEGLDTLVLHVANLACCQLNVLHNNLLLPGENMKMETLALLT
ncbi:hypothetical protein BC332_34012 [Capsicum chinense]|nr:hypothetical protein BC332_34012 [Capsicum chinense]